MTEPAEWIGNWVLAVGIYCLPCVLAGLVLGAIAVIVLRDACCRRRADRRAPGRARVA